MAKEESVEPEVVSLRTLVEHSGLVPATASVEMVQAEFTRTQSSFLAVIDDGCLLGVCARRELSQQLGSRFGFALNARQPIRDHLMAAPLRVAVNMPVTAVFQAAAARSPLDFYDDVLLVDEVGGYIGMITMRTLVRLQTDFLLRNISRLETSRREIVGKNREMEEDLQMAREVQLAMLPRAQTSLTGDRLSLRIAHRFEPAGGVSGDFFDVVPLSENAMGILVCDVMGHGVRSALVTAMVRAMLEEMHAIADEPGLLLSRLNRDMTRILRRTGRMIFVTAAYVVVDLSIGRIRYAQAGHPTPLLGGGPNGEIRPLRCPPECAGPALGLIDDFTYATSEEPIAAGHRVLLFTDGVFEAADASEEEFGEGRLAQGLGRQAGEPLEAALAGLLSEVSAFQGGQEFSDDVCLVGLEVTAAGSADEPALRPRAV